jgi:CHASE3 domain sensor protein
MAVLVEKYKTTTGEMVEILKRATEGKEVSEDERWALTAVDQIVTAARNGALEASVLAMDEEEKRQLMAHALSQSAQMFSPPAQPSNN